MAEPEPGRGQRRRGSASATVRAGFSIDMKSLRDMNTEWERAIKLVNQYAVALRKIPTPGMTGTTTGTGWIYPTQAHSTLSQSSFSTPLGTGTSGAPGSSPTPANGGAGTGGPGAAASPHAWNPMRATGLATAAVAGFGMRYGSQHMQNWLEADRLSQTVAWGNTLGNTGATMRALRTSWYNTSGYTNTADLLGGVGTLQQNLGYTAGAYGSRLMAQTGAIANLTGSFSSAAQSAAGLYTPANYYAMRSLGINIGIGQNRASQSQIFSQLLSRTFKGRPYTAQQVATQSQAGFNLYNNMLTAGITDPETQQALTQYGEFAANYSQKIGRQATAAEIQQALSKTGGANAAAKSVLGRSLYDTDRLSNQARGRIENNLANGALPALESAVNATTQAFNMLNGAMTGTGTAGLIGGGVGLGGRYGGAAFGAANNIFSSALGQMLAIRMLGSGGWAGAAERMRGFVPGRVGAAGAIGLRGGLAGVAGGLAGTAIGHMVGGPAGGFIGGAATGAAIGSFGGVPGALIGGGIGGLLGLFGGRGGNGSLNMDETGVLSQVFSGTSIGFGAMASTSAGSRGPSTTTPTAPSSSPVAASSGGTGSVAGPNSSPRVGRALAWMARQSSNPTQSWLNKCLTDVRLSLGVGAKYGTAAEAWAHTQRRHTGTPPAGVPVWWGGGEGHVALSAGGGQVWSNDILRTGRIDRVPISLITSKWHKPYLGWSEDVDGANVFVGNVRTAGKTGVASIGPTSLTGNKAYARSQLAKYGWNASQWASLDALWEHESGWNPNSQNPTSTAYGIAQFLNATWRDYGVAKTADPHKQIDVGLRYIQNRYGSPSAAWSKWQARSPHWYAGGAWEVQGDQLALIHHGEMVVPAATAGRLRGYARRQQAAGATPGTTTAAHRPVQVTINMPVQLASANAADAHKLVNLVARAAESDARLCAVLAGDN